MRIVFSKKLKHSNPTTSKNMDSVTKLRTRVQEMDPECMKGVCEQIAEIKRIVSETKKKLTKEERAAVRAYRHSMLERIQAADENHLEKEGVYVPRIRFTSDVFVKWLEIAKSIPSEHEFK